MAQTGFTPLLIYSSSTATNAPTAGNLLNNATGSELAINIADGKLFYKDSANAVQVIGWKTTPTTAGGTGLTSYTAGDMVYWASGTTFTKLGIGSANYIMTSSGTAPQWSASIGPAQGGTGITSYAVGDLIYASGTTTLSKLNDVATGNALISGGVGVAPSWGKIGLTTHVSGTLAVANGGTGLTSLTAGYVPYGNGTNAFNSSSTFTYNGTSLLAGNFIPSSSSIPTNGIYLPTTNTLGFATNTTLAMQISSTGGVSIGNTTDPGAGNLSVAGNLLVGTTSSAQNIANGFNIINVSAGTQINIGHANGSITGTSYATFAYNSTNIGSIAQTGTTAVLYNTTSDYRLKTNATPIQNALATINSLNPVSFTWIDGRKDDGFLAHEIQAVIPNCVTGEKDAVNEDGTPKYQQMDNSGVIPFLVKAIQELNNKFDAYVASHP